MTGTRERSEKIRAAEVARVLRDDRVQQIRGAIDLVDESASGAAALILSDRDVRQIERPEVVDRSRRAQPGIPGERAVVDRRCPRQIQ